MSSSSREDGRCERTELVGPYALAALEPAETKLMEAHLPTCAECQHEYRMLTPVTRALTGWRAQAMSPVSAWTRLKKYIASQDRRDRVVPPEAGSPIAPSWPEPQWREAAPGISCKLLSTDVETNLVSMLVRLLPGVAYPPHRHAAVEELYLLEGELWIEDRKLLPGDFNRAERGTADQRVWSGTGCMCLLITSPADELG
jgi:anti-sigma factor ChrR (cupin superfamily)